ncbi:hypothetical protein HQ590_06545 [bacterium]|nr:hypothetical protein [bacterium]
MANKQREFVIQLSQIGDALLIAVVFWLAHAFREELAFRFPLPVRLFGLFEMDFAGIAPFRHYKWLYLIILPVCPFLLDVNGFYSRSVRSGPWSTLVTLVKSVTLCALVVIAAMYFLGLTGLSRSVIVFFAVFTVAALFVKDRLFRAYLARRSHAGRHRRPIVLVGSAERNAEFERLLAEHPEWDFEVLARVDPTAELLKTLPPLLHQHAVSCVVFNVSQTTFAEVEKAIFACEIEGVEAWLVADFVRTSIACGVR